MTMTKWLEVARKYEGLAEVPGSKANPIVLGWLQNEGRGKSWVKDDATPWCGATMAGVFTECGLAEIIPSEPLRARAWEQVGQALPGPKIGCIAVIPRGNSKAQGHVALVVAFDDEHLHLLGGNQGDKVCVMRFKRPPSAVYRWPVKIKTAADVQAEGSRIAAAAQRQQRDAAKSTAAGGSPEIPLAMPQINIRGAVDGVVGDVAWVKATAAQLGDFTSFAGSRWPVIALIIAAYFAARIFWDGYRIRSWRAQDANEGWST